MSPKTGRPPKSNPKNVSLQLRISEETAGMLKVCAEMLETTRTAVIEKGIRLVYDEAAEKK